MDVFMTAEISFQAIEDLAVNSKTMFTFFCWRPKHRLQDTNLLYGQNIRKKMVSHHGSGRYVKKICNYDVPLYGSFAFLEQNLPYSLSIARYFQPCMKVP